MQVEGQQEWDVERVLNRIVYDVHMRQGMCPLDGQLI